MKETIETRAHTNAKGVLNLVVDVGVPDAEVAVIVHVRQLAPHSTSASAPSVELDPNGWPLGFFERISGSMPELRRAPQGTFEERAPLE